MPAPSATFSPLTMQKSDAELLAQAGQPFLDRAPAGHAEDVGEEEESQLQDERRRGDALDRDVVARVVRVARERLALDAARGRRPCRAAWRRSTDVEPTVSDGSARTCVSETTSDGALSGWMSMRDAELHARRRRTA